MLHLLTGQQWSTVHRIVPQQLRVHQGRQLPEMEKEQQALPMPGPYLDFASPIATTPEGRPIAVLRVETLSDAEGRVSSCDAIPVHMCCPALPRRHPFAGKDVRREI